MTRYGLIVATGIAVLVGLALGTSIAQQGRARIAGAPVPYFVGNRLGMPINPTADGAFTAVSSNVKVYGSVYSAESCSYDPVRRVIVVPIAAWDKMCDQRRVDHFSKPRWLRAHSRWIGVQNPGDQRTNMTPPLLKRAAGKRHCQRRALPG